MSKTIVVKFGGSSLADGARISSAAKAVAAEAKKGTKIAVVVSAIGKTTDTLLDLLKNSAEKNVEKTDLDEVLSMGERTSVRVFTAALKAEGLTAQHLDPSDPDWPIITDRTFSNANPILDECQERISVVLKPIIEKGTVAVIPGFIGRTKEGKVTTIGRGGSDTTAFILARALGASEVVLVTDSDGIMSADPKFIDSPRLVQRIDVNTLVGLADSGTKFIHRKALKYKDPKIDVRVINYKLGDLTATGTVIIGGLSKELEVREASDKAALSITIVGHDISERPGIIEDIASLAKQHSSLLGMSANHNSVILYLLETENLKTLLNAIHQSVLKHEETVAMAVRRNLAFLRIRGVGLEDTPGVLGRISEILRKNDINIFGMITITSSILVFVEWEKRNEALRLMSKALGDKKQ